MGDSELSLAARAAWLSYVGGLTQEEIAARLHISRVKVARLVGSAQRTGLVRVHIEGRIIECAALEQRLIKMHGLQSCTVAPVLDDSDPPLRALATAGANYLHRRLDQGGITVVGVGHGRTLGAVVDGLPRRPRTGLTFVSLLGNLTRKASTHAMDITNRLAEITDSEAYLLPAPFFVDSVEGKKALLAQRSLREVLDVARSAQICLLGIGNVRANNLVVTTGMIRQEEHDALVAGGAVAEILGRFLDRRGRPVAAEINGRSIGVPLEMLRGKEVVAVAGGYDKTAAIAAVLACGLVTNLITDEATATRLTEMPACAPLGGSPELAAAMAAGF